jgi:hypothetical protein
MNERAFEPAVAEALISGLLSNPAAFGKKGLANALLTQFLRGYPVERLHLLLRHSDAEVLRAAIWIASELPREAPGFLSDAIRLSSHPDRYIRHFSLDVIALATRDENCEEFSRILERLDDPDLAVAEAALLLSCCASDMQLSEAKHRIHALGPRSSHADGIRLLTVSSAEPAEIRSMLKSSSSLSRKYALIAAERSFGKYPDLMEQAVENKGDAFISSVAAHLLRLHAIRGRSCDY